MRFILIWLLLFFPLKAEQLLIRTIQKHRGEWEFCSRLKIAAANLGWEAEVLPYNQGDAPPPLTGTEMVVSLFPAIPCLPGVKNYLIHFVPHRIRDYREFALYDGFLIVSSNADKNFKGTKSIAWYPTVYHVPYREVTPKRLSYIYSHWGNRTDLRYKKLYQLLDSTGYFSVYGDKPGQAYPNSYKGEIPYDGGSLIDLFSEDGINLVLHSSYHHTGAIPSGRIFEAAAASAVIICDDSKFVRKYFGDSVLYFDHTQSGELMFEEINAHMEWIFSHPAEALDMAKRAHALFEEKFLLEKQLLKLKRLHEHGRWN